MKKTMSNRSIMYNVNIIQVFIGSILYSGILPFSAATAECPGYQGTEHWVLPRHSRPSYEGQLANSKYIKD
jgi:hypothetical protein